MPEIVSFLSLHNVTIFLNNNTYISCIWVLMAAVCLVVSLSLDRRSLANIGRFIMKLITNLTSHLHSSMDM